VGAVGRADCEALDREDPLAAFRDRFVIDDPKVLYLDGNSLGRLPRETRTVLQATVDEWGRRLVTAWDDWIDLPLTVGALLAEAVLGARADEVALADSTTVNLYRLAVAALDARPGRRVIVTDADNFPTDRYVFEGLAASHRDVEVRLVTCDPVDGPTVEDLAPHVGGDTALVSLSHVAYRSGALADMAGITALAHATGALTLWDLSHSAGSVPVQLTAAGVDLAVGCTYKYLNAGPGAPAFLYVRRDLQPALRQPVWGWFGQRRQFDMGPRYDPGDGLRAFLVGTPSVLGIRSVAVGAGLVAEAGVGRLREKSVALTGLIVDRIPEGCSLGSPADPARRGSHVSVRHPDAYRIGRTLIERAGVIPDFRPPDSIRLGVAPLYTRFVDVWDAMDRLEDVLARGEYLEMDPSPRRVT
jgi:kynureninase